MRLESDAESAQFLLALSEQCALCTFMVVYNSEECMFSEEGCVFIPWLRYSGQWAHGERHGTGKISWTKNGKREERSAIWANGSPPLGAFLKQ